MCMAHTEDESIALMALADLSLLMAQLAEGGGERGGGLDQESGPNQGKCLAVATKLRGVRKAFTERITVLRR